VLVLLNGSALAVNWARDHVPAIVEAWYPGQAGGAAIADVLFGDYNPGGRLPITFYQSADQLPAFDDYSMKGRTYRYFQGEPLYPFGYGLSYTRFTYQRLLVPQQSPANRDVKVAVEVTNSGKVAGEEVVQLYCAAPASVRWKVSSASVAPAKANRAVHSEGRAAGIVASFHRRKQPGFHGPADAATTRAHQHHEHHSEHGPRSRDPKAQAATVRGATSHFQVV
jgi:hypothetical protein